LWLRDGQQFTFEANFTTASHLNVSWEIEGTTQCLAIAEADPSGLQKHLSAADPTWEASPPAGTT
jgi:hypothetical protein